MKKYLKIVAELFNSNIFHYQNNFFLIQDMAFVSYKIFFLVQNELALKNSKSKHMNKFKLGGAKKILSIM